MDEGEGLRQPGRVSLFISGDTIGGPSRKPPLTRQSPLSLLDWAEPPVIFPG